MDDKEKRQISPHDSVLFIGLGGLGCRTLNAIKKIYRNEFENSEYIRFLAVDTDERAFESISCGNGADGCIRQDEQFVLWDPENSTMQERLSDPSAEIRRWIGDPDVKPLTNDSMAAVRSSGRVMLCGTDKYSMLRERIKQLIEKIHIFAHPARIVLIAGVSGQTGGGTFIDVSYMLREIEKNYAAKNNPLSTCGVFFTPQVQGLLPEVKSDPVLWRTLQTRGYAALKELDHFMSSGSKDCGAESIYTLDAPGGIHLETAWPIYDAGHVFRVFPCGGFEETVHETAHALMRLMNMFAVPGMSARLFKKWKKAEPFSQQNVDEILRQNSLESLAGIVAFVKMQKSHDYSSLRMSIDEVMDEYLRSFGLGPKSRRAINGPIIIDAAKITRGAEAKAKRAASLYTGSVAELAQLLAGNLEKYLEYPAFLETYGLSAAMIVRSGCGEGTAGICGWADRADKMIGTELPEAVNALEAVYRERERVMRETARDREQDHVPTEGEIEELIDTCWEYSKAYLEYLLYRDMLPELLAKTRDILADYNNRTLAAYVPVIQDEGSNAAFRDDQEE